VGADEQLYAGGKRIRLLGVNIGGAARFPKKRAHSAEKG